MPWEEILGGVTGGFAFVIVAAIFLGKLTIEKITDIVSKRLETRLKHVEELNKASVAFSSKIDIDLREKRIPVYAELWEKTGKLPMWPWNTELTYKDLHQLTGDLRDWYFQTGGIFLSETARDAFFGVQKIINASLNDRENLEKVSDDDYKAIRSKCSDLRTELTEDIFSRREAPDADNRTASE